MAFICIYRETCVGCSTYENVECDVIDPFPVSASHRYTWPHLAEDQSKLYCPTVVHYFQKEIIMKVSGLILAISVTCVFGFSAQNTQLKSTSSSPATRTKVMVESDLRRSLFRVPAVAFLTVATLTQQSKVVNAIPMITSDEFAIVLRDSALSIQQVEFSGPRSETVIVRLVDGTTFGIKDIVESSVDPRSPLKIAAACRESGVKTRFVELESILANAPKKKKMYTNQRVQDAAEKEREKQERIRQDEEERIRQVRKMEAEEEAAAAATASGGA